MIPATGLRRGMVIKKDGQLYTVFSATHKTPGESARLCASQDQKSQRAARWRNSVSRSVDMVEKVSLDEQEMEFLYKDGADYHFMNTETYEQIHLSEETLGDNVFYLIPNIKIKVEFYEGNPIVFEFPATVEMEVKETEPGLKSATASNVNKPGGKPAAVPPLLLSTPESPHRH